MVSVKFLFAPEAEEKAKNSAVSVDRDGKGATISHKK